MSAGRYWASRNLRARPAAWLLVALIVAVGAGTSMAAIAGARRTVSSPARFAADARTPDLVTDVDEAAFDRDAAAGGDAARPGFEAFIAAVDALPGVAGTSLSDAVAVARVADGVPDLTFPGQAFVSVDGDRYFRSDRVALSDGRMPDPDEPLEVLINESMARERNLAPGDRLRLDGLSAEGVDRYFGAGELDSFPLDLRVTGVGRLAEEALFDQLGDEQRMILTPAFAAEHDVAKMFSRLAVHLEPGADPTAVTAAILDAAGPAGRGFLFEDRGRVEERIQLAVRPYGVFVAGLGAIVAVFTLALAGQAATRVIGGLGSDVASLRALGLGRRRTILALLVAPLAATFAGTAVATVVAVLASSAFPIGPTRAVEPARGVDVDAVVLLAGVAVCVVAIVGRAALAAALVSRSHVPADRARSGSLASQLASVGAPVTLIAGVRRAFGSGRGDRRTTASAALVGMVLALAGLATVAAFDAGRRNLIDDPALHGWVWDGMVYVDGGYGELDPTALEAVPGVASATGVGFPTITVDGLDAIPAITAVEQGSEPAMVRGRAPEAPDELALGSTTAAELGVDVGDRVAVRCTGRCTIAPDVEPATAFAAGEEATMTVTGIAMLPAVGLIDTERPTLGRGAVLGLPPESFLGSRFGGTVLLDLDAGAAVAPTLELVREQVDVVTGGTAGVRVLDTIRPADIASYLDLGGIAGWLALALVVVAAATLVHGLVLSERQRQVERGVLGAIGLRPRQLRSILGWQAMVCLGVGAVVGIPLGFALGRAAWRALAGDAGFIASVPVPWAGTAAVLAGLAVVLLVAVAVLGRRGGRLTLAACLRQA